MTTKQEAIEVVARTIFCINKPNHMMNQDWDSGAVLGEDNAYRKHCLEMSESAFNETIRQLAGMDWDTADSTIRDSFQNELAEERAKLMLKQLLEE